MELFLFRKALEISNSLTLEYIYRGKVSLRCPKMARWSVFLTAWNEQLPPTYVILLVKGGASAEIWRTAHNHQVFTLCTAPSTGFVHIHLFHSHAAL